MNELPTFYALRVTQYLRFYKIKRAAGLTHTQAMERVVYKFGPSPVALRLLEGQVMLHQVA